MLFLMWMACNGCQPELPRPDDSPPIDTAPPEDSSPPDDSAPDTSPPALCDLEEVEPNDNILEGTPLPMEVWACGFIERRNDLDVFAFSNTEPGWVEINVEAYARGYDTDPQFQLIGNGTTAMVTGRYLGTDPRMVFPVAAATDWTVVVSDTNFEFGEDFGWFLLTSQTKAPVRWSHEEVEPNDSYPTAQVVQPGDKVFATLGETPDFDWYDVSFPGAGTFTVTIDAYTVGSPADTTLRVFRDDGTTLIATDTSGEIGYDPDPYYQRRIGEANRYYLQVRTVDDIGSPFHWYTLDIAFDPEEETP